MSKTDPEPKGFCDTPFDFQNSLQPFRSKTDPEPKGFCDFPEVIGHFKRNFQSKTDPEPKGFCDLTAVTNSLKISREGRKPTRSRKAFVTRLHIRCRDSLHTRSKTDPEPKGFCDPRPEGKALRLFQLVENRPGAERLL